jgi:hypothetical protein
VEDLLPEDLLRESERRQRTARKHVGKRGVNAIVIVTHKGIPAEALYKKNGHTDSPKLIILTHE